MEWENLCNDEYELEERVDALRINSVSLKGDQASITWDEITCDGSYGRAVIGVDDFAVELFQQYNSMKNYIPEALHMVMKGEDYNIITINRIGLKLKNSIEYARIGASISINGGKEIRVSMPEAAFYDFDRDNGNTNKTRKSFTKGETECLRKLVLEAKYYTLGKRRPEKANLFNREEE